MPRAVLLCGPSGAGKTSVGYLVFSQLLQDGHHAAFVDFDQLGLCRPAPPDDPDNTGISATNLACIWPNFRTAGATHLVASGIVHSQLQIERYRDALPDVDVVVCRLRIGPATQRLRMLARAAGQGPPLAGDDLKGRPSAALEAAIDQSIAEAVEMETNQLGDVLVDTDDLTMGEVAREIRIRAGL